MPDESYRVVLADLRRKRDELDAAIRALAAFTGEPVDESPAGIDETPAPTRETNRAKRATKKAVGETSARPTDALSEAAIRTALKAGHETPKALQTATKLKGWKLREQLAAMKKAGSVTTTGATNNLRYHLA